MIDLDAALAEAVACRDRHPGWPDSVWDEGDPAPVGERVRITGTPVGSRWEYGTVIGVAEEWSRARGMSPPSGGLCRWFVVQMNADPADPHLVHPARCVPPEFVTERSLHDA